MGQQPIRIGIFVVNFPAPSETFIVTKTLGLIEKGYDVRIFSARSNHFWDRFSVLKNREDIRKRVEYGPPTAASLSLLFSGPAYLLTKFLRYPRAFIRFLHFSWKNRNKNPYGFIHGFYLRSQFIGQSLDILHVEFDMQAIGLADIKTYLGCKLLISSRGTIQNSRIYYRYPDLKKWLFQHADGYHFISEFLQENTKRLGLEASTPRWLIQPAIDLDLFDFVEKSHLPKETIHILSVGRLAWAKGYEFAIDAIAEVYKAGVRVKYTILGEGDYRDAVIFAARQHGLWENGVVTLAGAVPREKVFDYYTSADILLHAALEEGFCNAVIEAQAMGIPVVTSDAGGLPENVENNVTGFVVPRRNPKAMAEKLVLLAKDPALRQNMGEAGRMRVQECFDLKMQVERFAAMYEELAAMLENRSY